jgi:hypothetical protein
MLVTIREKNQTKEAALAVRISKSNSDPSSQQDEPQPNLSERQLLARKIHGIIKRDQEQRLALGLGRHARTEKKSAAGSASITQDVVASGNTLNAREAARSTANAVCVSLLNETPC